MDPKIVEEGLRYINEMPVHWYWWIAMIATVLICCYTVYFTE